MTFPMVAFGLFLMMCVRSCQHPERRRTVPFALWFDEGQHRIARVLQWKMKM